MGSRDAFIGSILGMFAVAAILTFGCIVALQFTPLPWFFLVLVAMHAGIALFIISKKHFKKRGYFVSRYYRVQYLLLVPYLLLMFYSFAAKANLVPLSFEGHLIFVGSYTVFCVIVTVWNYIRMAYFLENSQEIKA